MAKTIFTMVSAESFKFNRRGSRFAKLSLEEIADDITSQNELVDVEQQQAQVETVVDAVEEGVEVAETLQEQADQQEQLVEQAPEQVTEEVVQVAQESLAYNLGRLSLSFEEFRSMKTSVESYGYSPVMKLKASTEGIKEFLIQIWEKIKAAFRTVWNGIKKIFGGTEKEVKESAKQINDILDKLRENKIRIINFDDLEKNKKEEYRKIVGSIGSSLRSLAIVLKLGGASLDDCLDINFKNLEKAKEISNGVKKLINDPNKLKDASGFYFDVKQEINLDSIKIGELTDVYAFDGKKVVMYNGVHSVKAGTKSDNNATDNSYYSYTEIDITETTEYNDIKIEDVEAGELLLTGILDNKKTIKSNFLDWIKGIVGRVGKSDQWSKHAEEADKAIKQAIEKIESDVHRVDDSKLSTEENRIKTMKGALLGLATGVSRLLNRAAAGARYTMRSIITFFTKAGEDASSPTNDFADIDEKEDK